MVRCHVERSETSQVHPASIDPQIDLRKSGLADFSRAAGEIGYREAWSRSKAICRSPQKTEAGAAASAKRSRIFFSWQCECSEKGDGERE
jgi:hypothetical protein